MNATSNRPYHFLLLTACLVGVMLLPLFAADLVDVSFEYWLQTQESGVSTSGFNTLALAFNPTDGAGNPMINASDVVTDIETQTTSTVNSISRYVRSTNALQTYAGLSTANDFVLTPGEGYLVQILNSSDTYTISGQHPVSASVTFHAKDDVIDPGPPEKQSAAGISQYAPPYLPSLCQATSLADLASGPRVQAVWRWSEIENDWESYAGDISPGEGYRVSVNRMVNLTPVVDLDSAANAMDELMSVAAYRSVPGCEAHNGRLNLNNDNPLEVRLDYSVRYTNGSGPGECTTCELAVDACVPACGEGTTCDWCESETGAEIPPFGQAAAAGQMPHCIDDCDNASSTCEAGNYWCNVLEEESFSATIRAFRCGGDLDWVETVCETAMTPCESQTDCPTGQSCVSLSVVWNGTVNMPTSTYETQLDCSNP